MAVPLLIVTILALSSSASFFTLTAAVTTTPNQRPFNKIYAFGDSFTDTGNTASLTGPSGFAHVSNSPYGITYFNHSTNRYSDGRLVIDFVTQSLSLPFLPPYRHAKNNASYGVNFAVGGSTLINHQFFVKNNMSLNLTPQSIQTQTIWFNKFLESRGCGENETTASSQKCRDAIDDALFWVGEIGVNDYVYTLGTSVSFDTILRLAIPSFTGFLQTLLKRGAKYVVVQGFPPTGCLPLALFLFPENEKDDIGCVKSVNHQSYTHNLVLQAKLQILRKQFPQTIITYTDYWNAYRTVMKNPKNYGFAETFKVCCGSGDPPYNFNAFATCGTNLTTVCPKPSQYINWDGIHLTEAMYKVVSDMFLNGTFSHPPFSYLLTKRRETRG